MTGPGVQRDVGEQARTRAVRLREAGVLLVELSFAGEPDSSSHVSREWLGDLCTRSGMARKLLRDAASRWCEVEVPAPLEAVPGMWLVPVAKKEQRHCVGYDVGILLTRRLLDAEQLVSLCQSAELDLELIRRLLPGLPLAAESEVDRLLMMVRMVLEEEQERRSDRQCIEGISRQLGESYEEMNLLYTIIQSMNVVQQPDRFVTTVCRELLATLPYRWIGARFWSEVSRSRQIAGQFIMAGESDQPHTELERLADELLRNAKPGLPTVIEPASNRSHAGFASLGRAVLVHPVSREGQVIGILIAAEKKGPDLSASSVDMQLLSAAASHLAILLENASLYDDLNASFLGTIEALTASIDAKDPYTCGHSHRVAHLTQQLALSAGLGTEAAGRMRIAGLVHDVGKIGVPESVLTKPGRLNDEEMNCIRLHPEIGYRILKDIPQLSDVLPGVLHHHERWDGNGYPTGLAGESIPLVARLIGLADAFDAMSSTRTYRPALVARRRCCRRFANRPGVNSIRSSPRSS